MITTPTTFIIGAGGSKPYGLPLAAEIRSSALELRPQSELYQLILRTFDVNSEQLDQWVVDLNRHPGTSIDEFMWNRPGDHTSNLIGKSVIAGLMAAALRAIQPNTGGDDWIERVANEMAAGAESIEQFANGNTGLRFVTFNFDSIIEDHIKISLQRRYLNPRHLDLAEVVGRVAPVFHVHGRLPKAPPGPMITDEGAAKPEWAEWIRRAVNEVNVIHDPIDDAKLADARAAVADASVLVCLGMAYHPENLNRLHIGVAMTRPPRPAGYARVFGSAKGLDESTKARTSRRFNQRISLANSALDCIGVLGQADWLD